MDNEQALSQCEFEREQDKTNLPNEDFMTIHNSDALDSLNVQAPDDEVIGNPDCPQCQGAGKYPSANGEDDFDLIPCDCTQ